MQCSRCNRQAAPSAPTARQSVQPWRRGRQRPTMLSSPNICRSNASQTMIAHTQQQGQIGFSNQCSTTHSIDDFSSDKRPVILYDGVCNLCNTAVNFMLNHDKQGRFRLAALQSPAGMRLLQRAGRRPDDISSIVLVEGDQAWIKSDAILKIAAGLSVTPLPLLALLGFPVPGLLRDWVYDMVANNRYSFMGQRDVCRLSNAGYEDRFIID